LLLPLRGKGGFPCYYPSGVREGSLREGKNQTATNREQVKNQTANKNKTIVFYNKNKTIVFYNKNKTIVFY